LPFSRRAAVVAEAARPQSPGDRPTESLEAYEALLRGRFYYVYVKASLA